MLNDRLDDGIDDLSARHGDADMVADFVGFGRHKASVVVSQVEFFPCPFDFALNGCLKIMIAIQVSNATIPAVREVGKKIAAIAAISTDPHAITL
jgi:hypothetical protein